MLLGEKWANFQPKTKHPANLEPSEPIFYPQILAPSPIVCAHRLCTLLCCATIAQSSCVPLAQSSCLLVPLWYHKGVGAACHESSAMAFMAGAPCITTAAELRAQSRHTIAAELCLYHNCAELRAAVPQLPRARSVCVNCAELRLLCHACAELSLLRHSCPELLRHNCAELLRHNCPVTGCSARALAIAIEGARATKGYSSTYYLAIGFANVRAGTWYKRALEYLSRYWIR